MHVNISVCVCTLLTVRLRLIPGFIAADECQTICEELTNMLPWQQETVVNGDETYLQPRLTAWFGDLPYSYSGIRHPPYTEVRRPIRHIDPYQLLALSTDLYYFIQIPYNLFELSVHDPSLTLTQFCAHVKTVLFCRAYEH